MLYNARNKVVKLFGAKYKTQRKNQNINNQTNALKITNSTCTSKSRQYIRKFTKRNQTNYIFFVLIKRNY